MMEILIAVVNSFGGPVFISARWGAPPQKQP